MWSVSKTWHLLSLLSFITLILSFQNHAQATVQNGLGFELGVGYPQISISDPTQNAKYSGVSVQGNVLFPLLSSGQFSMDLDLLYRYTSAENNSSNSTLSEWAHFTTFGSGLRFNYSFIFVGFDYLFAKGKHVRAGTSNSIFEYNFNPLQWHAGLSLPLSPVTSVVAGYSQMLNTDFEVQGSNFSANEQIFWLRLQTDFGVSFFNLLAPSESFQSTRSDFFVN